MKWMTVTVLVGIEDEEAATWGSGCDQTFGVGYLHKPEEHQYVVGHTRGFLVLSAPEIEELKTSTFDEGGGI